MKKSLFLLITGLFTPPLLCMEIQMTSLHNHSTHSQYPNTHPRATQCTDIAAKTCVTCCWTMATIPTAAACLINDLSGGLCCGKFIWSKDFRDNEELTCANSCPSHCIPNTRHALKALQDCRPNIMK